MTYRHFARRPVRVTIAVACLLLGRALPAAAQPAAGAGSSPVWRAGALLSVQPAGHANPPYLSEGLGGVVPGVSAGLDVPIAASWLIGVEMNTTWPMRQDQVGRLVGGLGVGTTAGHAVGSHSDTLVSILPSLLARGDRAHLILRAGISLVLGTPRRGNEHYPDNPAGHVAVTAGADIPLHRGPLAITPFGRYSLVRRGTDVDAFGLGRHVFRLGVDFRWGEY